MSGYLKGAQPLFKSDECLPPWFFPDHPGFMTLAGDILGKQDIPLSKPPLLAAAHLDFGASFKGDNILPTDNIMPGVSIIRRDFPEEEGLYTSRLGKKPRRPRDSS